MSKATDDFEAPVETTSGNAGAKLLGFLIVGSLIGAFALLVKGGKKKRK